MATNYPLLIFPSPTPLTRDPGNQFPRKTIAKPSIQKQGERLFPKFTTLIETFDRQNAELQSTAEGIDPEQVLVFETIGSVDGFITAIKNVDGLEWMSEIDIDDITPSEDFHYALEHDREKHLSGKLYLTMTNKRALEQMLSFWRQYSSNPDYKFARGTTGFRDLFTNLKDIRRWDIQERLLETGAIRAWEENLIFGQSSEKVEIQLWFYDSEQKRRSSQTNVIDMIREVGGTILSCSIIHEISYHAILADIPTAEICNIISSPNTRLVGNNHIMFFRPTGQMSIDVDAPNDNHEIHDHSNALDRFPAKPPVAALLDGMPLENHEVLTNRLIIDDPDNFSENYESSYRKHGTGMSSLIIHGDLSADEEPISSYLYVRPIMKIKHWFDKTEEAVPNDILFVDLLHQSVKRIFEGDKYATPITSIKVINLSIGDRSLPFYQTMSPVAKLLDWLSFKYKVLFIISTGNHCDNIQLEETYGDFKLLDNNLKEKRIYSKVIKDQRNRRLLSPSESMNNITVGSIHSDFSNYSIGEYDRRINPTERIMPSVFSAFGLGYRDSIKPDFVYLGGKQFIIEPYSDLQPADFKCDLSHQRPGNCIARPDATLSNVYYSRGTSDATALTTRNAIKIADVLMEILDEQYHLPEYSSYIPLLIKALLAHGCSWLEIEDNIHNILKDEYTGSEIKTILTKWIGYGIPNFEKALSGTEQRVTVLGFGELTIDKSHLYRFPLPPSLSSKYGKRKLTVTLAWFTPIASKTQKYKKVKLFFEQNSKLDIVRGDADRHKVRKGTLQHEIFEGVKASAFEDDDYVEIKVTCMADAQKDVTQIIPYSIAVTLEVADGVDVPIYQEVRDRLITPITIESIQ